METRLSRRGRVRRNVKIVVFTALSFAMRLCGRTRARVRENRKTRESRFFQGEFMSKVKTKYMLGVGLMAALLAGSAHAQTGGQNVDWPVYLGDISGSKFKPLDQINASNFSNLEVAWRFKTDNMGNRPEFKLEGTPLEVNG